MVRFRILLFTMFVACSMLVAGGMLNLSSALTQQPENQWVARPLHLAEPAASPAVAGYSPTQIRTAYNLPSTGGTGTTIAIVNAYDAPTIRMDLEIFCNYFNLTQAELDVYRMPNNASSVPVDPTGKWPMETALDVEWAHAIAPQAKILLVQARSPLPSDLLAAVDYARGRSDVVAISMSWGDDEYSTETAYDYRLTSTYGAVFFASSGDNGSGVLWPSSSVNVVAVGGTTLNLDSDGSVSSETAWRGSGGGISAYEAKPLYQTTLGISGNKRTVPDVSYNANPNTGVAVYSNSRWYQTGGTSAGAPQWAAIQALGRSSSNTNFYQNAKSPANASYFRDITVGTNGAYYAGVGYDFVTGLGSPLTINFLSSVVETNSVTLVQAEKSTPLNSTNQFTINYVLNGTQKTAYASNGTLTLEADPNTNLIVSGTSTGSTAQEKWVLNSDGSPIAGANRTVYYYDLLAQTASYAIVGGGNPLAPTLTYSTAPLAASNQSATRTATIGMSQTAQTVWALKGTTVSVTNSISAGSTEQWVTKSNSVPVQNAASLSFPYFHQYLLNVTGAQVNSQWYNSSETAQISVPGVMGRASGAGQKLTGYSIDGVSPTQVQPTLGTVNISIAMNRTHQLQLNSFSQYQVALDDSSAKALSSITPPTINGDTYWYDEATQVRVVLSGVVNRSAGTGQRISSYSVNGVSTNAATTGSIVVVNLPLFSAQTVSAKFTDQYKLSTPSGSISSITAPLLAGDAGWYDSGTTVTATYDYSWNATGNQSRVNAVSYTIGQGAVAAVQRSRNGTFPIQITLTEPETVAVSSVTQYHLNISGGYSVAFSQTSPTGDDFFDSGTTISATTENVWTQTADENLRQRLVSYVFDGATVNVSRSEAGSFTTLLLTFDKAHQLTFNSVTQYLVSFQFKDYSGNNSVTPSAFQMETDNSNVVDVPQLSLWLDSGTNFRIHKITWQNADVQPAEQASHIATAPLNLTVQCNIFDAKLTAKDYLNIPVSGAKVTVTLANQTIIQAVTSGDGTVNLPMIPLGTFRATIDYLGTSTTVAGNASQQPVTTGKIFTSLPTIGLITVAAIIAILTAAVVIRKRHASGKKKPLTSVSQTEAPKVFAYAIRKQV